MRFSGYNGNSDHLMAILAVMVRRYGTLKFTAEELLVETERGLHFARHFDYASCGEILSVSMDPRDVKGKPPAPPVDALPVIEYTPRAKDFGDSLDEPRTFLPRNELGGWLPLPQ